MRNVFLSGPMSSSTHDDNFGVGISYVENIDDARLAYVPLFGEGSERFKQQSHSWFRAALSSLPSCDELWLLPGWRAARGCLIEVTIALSLNMPLYEWIDENTDCTFVPVVTGESLNQYVAELFTEQDRSFLNS